MTDEAMREEKIEKMMPKWWKGKAEMKLKGRKGKGR